MVGDLLGKGSLKKTRKADLYTQKGTDLAEGRSGQRGFLNIAEPRFTSGITLRFGGAVKKAS
ncbi:hypothetical protein AT727_09320 [Desulfitobacterium hafniense]|uniref:Uncharacterized protein n=1 Tax=Desulfitobacterium hafniense TaxID=49338 RepID=A0A0W1JF77_DESHA|nr:hypothetical protein AT727_09320 [Desulfitobacterium hafniense]